MKLEKTRLRVAHWTRAGVLALGLLTIQSAYPKGSGPKAERFRSFDDAKSQESRPAEAPPPAESTGPGTATSSQRWVPYVAAAGDGQSRAGPQRQPVRCNQRKL